MSKFRNYNPTLLMCLRGIKHHQTLAASGRLGKVGVRDQASLIAKAEEILGRPLKAQEIQNINLEVCHA